VHRAKGLEFPVVIIPELQSPLRRGGDPEFLVIPGWGLEVGLPLADGQDTRSPRFAQELAAHDRERIEEELRIFYVAVTRAQHALILIAGGPDRINPPTSEYYSWKDELLPAWPALAALGAIRV
jgi:DNA helicase-2/ATP-dependent DNA helicase PcrA